MGVFEATNFVKFKKSENSLIFLNLEEYMLSDDKFQKLEPHSNCGKNRKLTLCYDMGYYNYYHNLYVFLHHIIRPPPWRKSAISTPTSNDKELKNWPFLILYKVSEKQKKNVFHSDYCRSRRSGTKNSPPSPYSSGCIWEGTAGRDKYIC